ncbi:MAG: xanthine dehydrogenase family protein molybdopterin-binding subunit [Candidatus Dormibacter sp.]|uniref:xanthine dehydrogenase family protein molybdopterin-binding subunit n=1 Tax=Candidatus Dormibacter sp. TaxID=2973982 RepID=UPI003D9B3FCA
MSAPPARSAESAELRIIGRSQRKLDGRDKVLGRTRFISDLQLPGQLVGRILRSPHPHARILSLDVAEAERLPGVHAVLHAGNVTQRPFGYGLDNLPLKQEKVRCAGDEVAAVAAEDEATAERALELIEVEYEPLPAVYDPHEALAAGAPAIHPQLADLDPNVSMRWDFDHGDVEQASRAAHVIVEGTFQSPLSAPASIETHCCIAAFDSEGRLDVWTGVHMAFMYRKAIADTLQLDWRDIVIHQPPIGGSFGGKIDIDPLDFITVLLAKAARRPVKVHLSREEEFVGSRVRQPMQIRLRTGADKAGNLLFRDADVISDNGAYNAWGSHALLVVMQSISSLYRVPNCRVRARVVYTNKAYGGSVRGFGNPEATFAIEQQTEEIADRLGLDPIDLRLMNANRSGDVTPQGMRITSCGLAECLEEVRKASGWAELRGRRRHLHRGFGAAAYIHVGGGARIYPSDGCGSILKIDEAGRVTLISGASELGQGSETVLAMVTAESLGVPLSAVSVVNDSTELKPWDVGAHASRTTFVAGNSARLAAVELRQKLLETASEILEVDAADLTLSEGVIAVRGAPDSSLAYDKVARRRMLRQGGSMLMATSFYDPPTEPQDRLFVGNISAAYGFGAHVAEVEVEPDSGLVHVLNLWCAHDVGRALNPAAVEGQVLGGAVMGLGLALTEELGVADGQLLRPSPREYGMLTALGIPPIHVIPVETIDPEGPFGAKGVGEAGVIPVAAAIANAVADATGVHPHGYPIAPWKLLDWLRGREVEAGASVAEGRVFGCQTTR